MPDSPHPSEFNADIGGYNGDSYQVSLGVGGSLSYMEFGRGYTPKNLELTDPFDPSPDPTPEQWAEFHDTLDRIGFWDWEESYTDHSVMDGTSWSVEIEWDGRKLSSGGSNGSPKKFGSFLRAVRKLLGGRKFS